MTRETALKRLAQLNRQLSVGECVDIAKIIETKMLTGDLAGAMLIVLGLFERVREVERTLFSER